MADLSIVIPTLGRASALEQTLERLAGQVAQPPALEVIVVMDARARSGEETEALVAALPLDARVKQARRPGASAARNVGWREARAPIVLFLGDDILADPTLVGAHAQAHARQPQPEIGVLGLVEWARQLRVTTFMRWLDRGVQFDYGSIEGREAGWSRFYTANVSVKRELLERVGGFDEERLPYLYEDLDLAYRMTQHGFRLRFEPAARGEHLHEQTIEGWQARAGLLASAEQAFVAKHPELDAYFLKKFAAAEASRPARGRAARLAPLVPPSVPVLGPWVWASVDARFRQALAPYFLAAWRAGTPPGDDDTDG